jgi:hypothetical protein
MTDVRGFAESLFVLSLKRRMIMNFSLKGSIVQMFFRCI